MDNTIQIAERIKQLRKNLGLNQSEFCKKLGIKQSTLSSYENGTVSPSNEALYAIAKQYHVSLDWLFGISDNEFSLSSMGDIISFLLELNELKELRYELEINDKFFNDIETEDNRWYANIKFYGNFTPKDMFDIWKKQKIADYSSLPVTKKVYEDIDNATRMKLRNEHLERQFKKNQSDSE